MNKKFSTLVATLLLSGALVTVGATEIKVGDTSWPTKIEVSAGQYVFTDDVTLSGKDCIIVSEDNAIVYGNNHTLKGQLIITGKNVKVYDLNVDFTNACESAKEDGTVPAAKSAVLLNSEGASLYNVTITATATDPKFVADGIGIVPTDKTAKFIISGCKITAADIASTSANPDALKTASTGIMVWENCPASAGAAKSVALDTPVTITDTEFIGCSADYAVTKTTDSGALEAGSVKELIVTPLYKDGKLLNGDAITGEGGFKYVNDKSKIVFKGSANELLETVAEVSGTNVAVVCNDGNILLGTATNPDNGKGAIIAGIDPLNKDLFGYELVESATSDYCMLVLHSDNSGDDYAIMTGETNLANLVKASNISSIAVNPKALWKMTSGKDHDGKIWYQFENKAGEKLTVGGASSFFPENNAVYNNGVVFEMDGLDLTTKNKNYFGLYKAGNNVLTVADLMWFENDGFSVTIKYQNEKGEFKKEDIAGNPFQKHLTPMYWNGSKFVAFDNATKTNNSFYLKDAEGKYIVAQKYASSGSVTAQSTYTFTTVSETALTHDILRKEGNYFGEFKAEVSAKYTDYKKLEAIDVLKVKLVAGWAEIGRLDLGTKEVPTLASSVTTELKPILVSLGSNKVVNPKDLLAKDKFYTVTKLDANGKVLGKLAVADDLYDGDGYTDCEFVTSYGNVLEGQFALTYEGGRYVFTNREAPNYKWYLAANTLYEGEAENLYVSGNTIYKIETVEKHSANDGYETLADVKNNKFHIGFSSNVFGGNAWFTENHEGTDNHTIGLNIDLEDALTFTATEYAAARKIEHDKVDTHKDTYVPTDSIYVISTMGYYSGNDYKVTKDTLKVVSYSFVNQFTEPLVYDNNRYVSKVYKNEETKKRYASVEEAAKDAQKFALRLDNGKLNLRPVTNDVASMTEDQYAIWGDAAMYQLFNAWSEYYKIYAGDATNGILDNSWIYDRTENDLFVVEPTEKPMYRPVINPLDTISIFRNDNPKSILFEDKGFLGMENLAQYPSIAPAMVADTAYVRDNTYRPQYMLVVNPKITPAGKWCPIHGDDPTCPDAHKVDSKGWVEGRYLVNLVDTAIVWDQANKHKDNNPYINTEKYYRLGFVQAKHIEDSLVIASTNDTLMVGSEDYNQAKFAFRYVDTDAKSFRIETANYEKLPGVTEAVRKDEGYVKWMNGVVVVVDNIEDGDIFNMNEDEQGDPTANDEISASEVSVSATNGAIIVNGAAGKNVVITNVLGQTIANTVLSSDEAQIAVSAGVVVVAVEGEAAVKAIVK